MNLKDRALDFHKEKRGKLEVSSKVSVNSAEDLSLAYSPGVAEPCKEIHKNVDTVYDYTFKSNTIAVLSNGTAVLGLGNIGPEAGLPVMEGKAILFKQFGGVDAFPICIDAKTPAEVITIAKSLAPTFGGINLEDISAPDCFEIEDTLVEEMNIPVFHDDQHGTAIVTVAGLINALKIVRKTQEEIRIVINGAGSAGIAIARMLKTFGFNKIIMCDTKGAIYSGRPEGMNPVKERVASFTNLENQSGTLQEVLVGADVFIGVSVADAINEDDVKSMAKDSIIFAMANPDPEITPDKAISAGAAVVGTGRSDYPNQVNNVLAFPGIFRGALDVHSTKINDEMKIAAVKAIAGLVSDDELNSEYVIPSPFDKRVAEEVAVEVAKAACLSGVARKEVTSDEIRSKMRTLLNN